MQLLNVTNLPIYLPRDAAHEPFGDPFDDLTATSGAGSAPAVFTAAGYEPTNGDMVQLSFTAGGSLPSTYSVFTTYYVVSADQATGTFELATTAGGTAANSTGTGADMVLHLLTEAVQPITLPFKPNNSALCVNQSAGTLVLQGAPDLGNGSGDPQGPGAWVDIASLTAGSMALVALLYDWIRVSTTGTLSLVQN